MNTLNKDPITRLWITCFALFCVVNALVRAIILAGHWSHGEALSLQGLMVFPIGLINDIAIGAILSAPIFLALRLFRPLLKKRGGMTAVFIAFFLVLLLLCFTAAAELIFWGEFDSRFNTTAVYYLVFPREVLGNIRESFDLRLILPPVVFSAATLFWFMRKGLRDAVRFDAPDHTNKFGLAATAILVVISAGYLGWGPLHPFKDRVLNEVSDSGYRSFLASAISRKTQYEGYYPELPPAEAVAELQESLRQSGTSFPRGSTDNATLRHVRPHAPEKKLNVVLIIEESFGSVYYDDLGPEAASAISPNFHKLAAGGMFFKNIYSTGDRTVRGLEALLTSFAPIPGISTVRRPGHDGMYSLPWVLNSHGYDSAFLYGGHSGFDNMRQYWESIGFRHVWEQDDIREQGFATVWGVADEYLFEEALKRLDENTGNGKPFFLGLLTTTNHRPFTYPAGRISADPLDKKRENSAAYADWALGAFIEKAKSHSWFEDTVFVVIGDHGPKVFGRATVPVQAFRVPLTFYSPKNIAPSRHEVVGSSLDVAPTLLGLLGLEYDNPFFGRDLQMVAEDDGRASMSYNFTVAYAEHGKVAVLKPNATTEFYAMTNDILALHPLQGKDPKLEKKAIAQTQTAYNMFYSHHFHFN
ncbi:MAG: LTA synthase family protein [Rhodospirillales bacterium]|nr:LTA synthase family protein [Rhodospirillales bacterium]MCW8951889.1 LTA synthase family protein [Rhodospirillales bacterium]